MDNLKEDQKTIGLDEFNVSLSGISNSRLNEYKIPTSIFGVKIDSLTITGNLTTEATAVLAGKMKYGKEFNILESLQTKFRAQVFNNKVYMEYDKVRGNSWNRRNTRIDFNPSRLTNREKMWLKTHVVSLLDDLNISRLDLAFDVLDDLNNYIILTRNPVKRKVIFGKNGKPETKYFGSRKSNKFIRIYNKKKELKDTSKLEIPFEHLWRIEFELKGTAIKGWRNCLNDLSILKPDWKSIENIKEQAMIYLLINENDRWGYLDRKTKAKYKRKIKEISEVNLVSELHLALVSFEKTIQENIDYWLY